MQWWPSEGEAGGGVRRRSESKKDEKEDGERERTRERSSLEPKIGI